MTIDDAIELCAALQPRVAVPVHYDGWSHFAEGRAAIVAGLGRAPSDVQGRFRFLEPGVPATMG